MASASSETDFDCIVIGSGFGGSVMAYRLASEGRRVLVLERGKAYAPGDFPRTPLATSTNVWDPSQQLYGLFDIWSFKKFESLVSSGLGGGSLIYANVMMRKPPGWFDTEAWPVSYDDLAGPYSEVETMLGVTPYPHLETTRKTQQVQLAAGQAGLDWARAPLAVSFGAPNTPGGDPVPGNNLHNVPRSTCVRCGQCDVGCNLGSKNSLDLTYLSRAKLDHACIKTLHEVRQIRPLDDGRYEVHAVEHVPPKLPWNRDGSRPDPRRVQFRARCVVVAAGALGSSYLLLRNRVHLPKLSATLGTRFCGNADYLGFIRAGREHVMDSSRAPVITSFVGRDLNSESSLPGGDPGGHVVQDGGYPALAEWLGETLGIKPVKRVLQVALALALARLTDVSRGRVSARLTEIVGDSASTRVLVPMLGMGRDRADGVMRLRKGYLDVHWQDAYSEPAFGAIRATMEQLAQHLGGTFRDGPSTRLSRMITVHPLGGAPMGRDPEHGVVDDYGEVFGYPGLFVADGSVMPGPVGVNPSLTIAALAHRFSGRVVDRAAG